MMALSATGVFEVRVEGNDDNAGYFNPGGGLPGADWSQQNAPQIVIDGSTISATVHSATTQINLSVVSVSSAWNRNGLRITGGSATAGLYEITAVDVANNRITVDRSAGSSGATVQGRVGGSLASPGGLGRDLVAHGVNGLRGWIRAGTYTLSTATENTPGGPFNHSVNQLLLVRGYGTDRGDESGMPIINAGSQANVTLWQASGGTSPNVTRFRNIGADGNSMSNVVGFSYNDRQNGSKLFARRCTTGFSMSAEVTNSVAEDCATGFNSTNSSYGSLCYAIGCGVGFSGIGAKHSHCIAHDCTGNGFSLGIRSLVDFCQSVNNGGDGFRGESGATANHCLAVGNDGSAFHSTDGAFFVNRCFGFDNGGFITGSPRLELGNAELTADPFADAANGNFNINNVPGGGAVLRDVDLPLGDTTLYPFGSWWTGGGASPRIISPYLIGDVG